MTPPRRTATVDGGVRTAAVPKAWPHESVAVPARVPGSEMVAGHYCGTSPYDDECPVSERRLRERVGAPAMRPRKDLFCVQLAIHLACRRRRHMRLVSSRSARTRSGLPSALAAAGALGRCRLLGALAAVLVVLG